MTLPERSDLANVAWYRQGAAAKSLYIMPPFRACLRPTIDGEQIPDHYRVVTWLSADDKFFVYFDRRSLVRVAEYYLAKQQSNPTMIQTLRERWHQRFRRPVLELADAVLDALSSSAPDELLLQFQRLCSHYETAWNEAIFHDAFDVAGEPLLERALRGQPAQTIEPFLHARGQSPYQQERRLLFALASELKPVIGPDVNLPLSELGTRAPELTARLEQHAKAYHWIQNDYATVVHLGANDFFARIQQLMRTPSQWQAEAQFVRDLEQAPPPADALSDELRPIVDLLATVSVWRDERKAFQQEVTAAIEAVVDELCQRFDQPLEQAEHCDWLEIDRFCHRDPALLAQLARREGGVLHVNSGRELHEFTGSEALAVKESIDALLATTQLTGRPAYPGKVQGSVCLVYDRRDFGKFRAGDILVAPNTRPEYLPIMRLARAILTEEGGLTSHAAIVARELSVPTVVGVQGITTALRDGDVVEIDATTGVVQRATGEQVS